MLVGLILAAAWHIDATVALLPDSVATHFAGGGRPNGWMTREGYRVFMLLFVTLLPLFMVAMAGWLPRLFPPPPIFPTATTGWRRSGATRRWISSPRTPAGWDA